MWLDILVTSWMRRVRSWVGDRVARCWRKVWSRSDCQLAWAMAEEDSN
jgi:hypothetical protein